MFWWLLGYYYSTSTTTSGSCPFGFLPWPGATGVSPDAVVTFVDPCGSALTGTTGEPMLVDDVAGFPVPGTARASNGIVVFTPDEPFAPGWYRAHLPAVFGTETSFQVGEPDDALPLSPGLEVLDLDLRRTCRNTFRGFRLVADLALEEPRNGLLEAHVTTDGHSAGWQVFGAGADLEPVTFGTDVVDGLHEHCVQARLLDETGAVAWTSDPACVSPEPCPPPEPSGCATAPASPFWALALLGALRWPGRPRSRSRPPAAGRSRTPGPSSSPPPR